MGSYSGKNLAIEFQGQALSLPRDQTPIVKGDEQNAHAHSSGRGHG
jgi:hypothetical protein